MEMTDLMRFDFAEDHIVTPTHKFYFYEIKAPNFTTLSETESEGYHIVTCSVTWVVQM